MLRRGLPLSLLIHGTTLLLVVVFGNQVARHPARPAHAIKVRMVRLPTSAPPPKVATAKPVPARPQPRVQEQLPPKVLPKAPPKPRPKPKPEIKPEKPVVRHPEEPVEETPPPVDETPVVPAVVAPPAVKGTDENFPFAWYIGLVEGKVVNNWRPRQLGFGQRAVVSCTVHFRVGRNGAVSEVTLVRNSGVGVFDRESLRAVKTTRLPPLPPQYRGRSLGITFIFNLEPGH